MQGNEGPKLGNLLSTIPIKLETWYLGPLSNIHLSSSLLSVNENN